MTSTILRFAAGCMLALSLAGCGSSPPSTFYRLTPASTAVGSGQQPSLGVGPVTIPEYLDRTPLVYSGGDNRLQIAGNELWAEPLADGITRVIGLNLARLLGTQNLAYFPWDTRQAPEYGIRLNILDLDATDGEARLTADWVVYHPGDAGIISRRISSFSQTLSGQGGTAAQLPPAYSALLYQLSETIATAIRDQQQSEDAAGEP